MCWRNLRHSQKLLLRLLCPGSLPFLLSEPLLYPTHRGETVSGMPVVCLKSLSIGDNSLAKKCIVDALGETSEVVSNPDLETGAITRDMRSLYW